jgi:hypothetical protein
MKKLVITITAILFVVTCSAYYFVPSLDFLNKKEQTAGPSYNASGTWAIWGDLKDTSDKSASNSIFTLVNIKQEGDTFILSNNDMFDCIGVVNGPDYRYTTDFIEGDWSYQIKNSFKITPTNDLKGELVILKYKGNQTFSSTYNIIGTKSV